MRAIRWLALAVASAGLSVSAAPAWADPSWVPIALPGTQGGNIPVVHAVTDSGQVVGQDGHGKAFSWTPEDGLTEIGFGGSYGDALAVNTSGMVLGYASSSDDLDRSLFSWTKAGGIHDLGAPNTAFPRALSPSGRAYGTSDEPDGSHAWTWTASSGYVDLGAIPAPRAGALVFVTGVSTTGVFVGGAYTSDFSYYHAFSWTSSGGSIDLGTLPTDDQSYASVVNASGQIAGTSRNTNGSPGHPVVWQGASVIDLGSTADAPGNSAVATAIADDSQVVGTRWLAGPESGAGSNCDLYSPPFCGPPWPSGGPESHAFSWTAAGGTIDIGTLGFIYSDARAVSENGAVVGVSGTGTPTTYVADHGFVWTAAKGIRDLGTLPAWTSSSATAVSPNGRWIAGYGYVDNDTAWQDLVWQNTDQPPAITSGTSMSVGMRSAFDFQVTTTGSPTPALSETGGLPVGVTFTDNGDGTAEVAGAASAGTAGTYPITVTASNGVGSPATQHFVLTVTAATSPPLITSGSEDTETFGVAFAFTVSTTGYPAPTIKKSGNLPAGVTFTDNGNGTATIAGTPARTAIGAYPLTLTAKSSAGTATLSFNLKISKAPIIKKIPATTAHVGVGVGLTFTSTGFTVPSVEVSGLFDGLAFTDNGNGTGTITGTPPPGSGGSYTFTAYASNALGTASQTFTFKVLEAPAITSDGAASAAIGSPFSFQVRANGFPAPKISRTGTLPKGVTYNAATATFSGVPKANGAGTYPIMLSARNSSGTATQQLTITVH